jgi:hypothetical protein
VDKNGNLAVCFYDRRADAGNFRIQRYCATSTDMGSTWKEIAATPYKYAPVHAQDVMGDITYWGDYDTLAVDTLGQKPGFIGPYCDTNGRSNPDIKAAKFAVIVDPAAITVTAPNGGETWKVGTTQTVQWSYTGNPGPTVKVQLLKAGTLHSTVAAAAPVGTGGKGTYEWSIPTGLGAGNEYTIRVISTADTSCKDVSDAAFTIEKPVVSISVKTPNGGETWDAGTSQTIQWTFSGNPGDSVKIQLWKGEALNRTIVKSTPIGSGGAGSFAWLVPAGLAAGSDYTIRVISTANAKYQDASDGSFTIARVQPLPNLTPARPPGWDDKIVVSFIPGTHTDDRPIWSIDQIYVDWAVINAGSADIAGNFRFDLYLDGTLVKTWAMTFGSWPPNEYTSLSDYYLGSLAVGQHTIQLVVDPLNGIRESNEADNSYTKVFMVE